MIERGKISIIIHIEGAWVSILDLHLWMSLVSWPILIFFYLKHLALSVVAQHLFTFSQIMP